MDTEYITYTAKFSDIVNRVGEGELPTYFRKLSDGLWEFYIVWRNQEDRRIVFHCILSPEAWYVTPLGSEIIPFTVEPFDDIQHYEKHCNVRVTDRMTESMYIALCAAAYNSTSEQIIKNKNFLRKGYYFENVYLSILDKQNDIHAELYFFECIIKDTDMEVTETTGTEFDELLDSFSSV